MVTERCSTCGHDQEIPDVLCNLCGLSCTLKEEEYAESGGLIKASVTGGYFSTPGNGVGALDDNVTYTFSLCEFCLDWLFDRFKIPVKTKDGDIEQKPWRPASCRVAADDWRKMKQQFVDEAQRRTRSRR